MECQKPECGYLFIPYGSNAALCNECGGGTFQPRVCTVGGEKTDWLTLLRLAQYVLQWDTPNAKVNLKALLQAELTDAIKEEEGSA